MARDRYAIVLRILDDQNRLAERADQKAISLLSALGIFTVFFFTFLRDAPRTPITVILLTIYLASALLALLHIILAINPRVHPALSDSKGKSGQEGSNPPTFFASIVRYTGVSEYRKSLDELLCDEDSITDVYTQEIYEVAKINAVKYRLVSRIVIFVVITLVAQLSLIAYTFVNVL